MKAGKYVVVFEASMMSGLKSIGDSITLIANSALRSSDIEDASMLPALLFSIRRLFIFLKYSDTKKERACTPPWKTGRLPVGKYSVTRRMFKAQYVMFNY